MSKVTDVEVSAFSECFLFYYYFFIFLFFFFFFHKGNTWNKMHFIIWKINILIIFTFLLYNLVFLFGFCVWANYHDPVWSYCQLMAAILDLFQNITNFQKALKNIFTFQRFHSLAGKKKHFVTVRKWLSQIVKFGILVQFVTLNKNTVCISTVFKNSNFWPIKSKTRGQRQKESQKAMITNVMGEIASDIANS